MSGFKDFLNGDEDWKRQLREFIEQYEVSPRLNVRLEGIADPDAPKVSERTVWLPNPVCTVCGSVMDLRQPEGYWPIRTRLRIYCHTCQREEWIKPILVEVANAPEKT